MSWPPPPLSHNASQGLKDVIADFNCTVYKMETYKREYLLCTDWFVELKNGYHTHTVVVDHKGFSTCNCCCRCWCWVGGCSSLKSALVPGVCSLRSCHTHSIDLPLDPSYSKLRHSPPRYVFVYNPPRPSPRNHYVVLHAHAHPHHPVTRFPLFGISNYGSLGSNPNLTLSSESRLLFLLILWRAIPMNLLPFSFSYSVAAKCH